MGLFSRIFSQPPPAHWPAQAPGPPPDNYEYVAETESLEENLMRQSQQAEQAWQAKQAQLAQAQEQTRKLQQQAEWVQQSGQWQAEQAELEQIQRQILELQQQAGDVQESGQTQQTQLVKLQRELWRLEQGRHS